MDINIIGVPLKYGCDIDGVQDGPDKLREAGIIKIFRENNLNIYDMGNVFVPRVDDKDKYKDHKTMKYLESILETNNNLAHKVYSSLEAGSFPLVLGGDHALSIGSIAGARKFYENMAVIWVDAHGDINTPETSPSGNIHGMPLAASMGLGYDRMVDLYFKGQKVKPENTYIIGARSLDQGEIDLINNSKINFYPMDVIKDIGLGNVLEEVKIKILESELDGVHFSFDIDVLDKKIVPGTGTPEIDGFSIDDARYTIEYILSQGFVRSMDFVEFNPLLDEDNHTLNTCLDLLKIVARELCQGIKQKA